MHIRPARPQDLPELLELVQGLALHHGDTPTVTLTSLERDFFGQPPWFHCLVAEKDAAAIAYAAMLPRARLGFGQRGMDLHHLFVAEPHRNQGIGTALIEASVALARTLDCAYFLIGIHPDNAAAQTFYPKLGFRQDSGDSGIRFFKLLSDKRPLPD